MHQGREHEENQGVEFRAGCLGQRLDIPHRDTPRIEPLDRSNHFQLFQLAADGFQAETEIVGHFGARERHDKLAAWPLLAIGTWSRRALQDRKQQRRHFLLRSLAAEQEHPIASGVDRIQRALEKDLLQVRLFLHEPFKVGAPVATELNFRRGLGCVREFRSVRSTKKIAGKQQGHDLLTAIR